jgi:AsmA family/AsmA-like C-terminal region
LKLKWILIAAGALVLLLAGALAALPWLVDGSRVQAHIAQAASQALGRPVRFASMSLAAFPRPSVRFKGLQVAEDPKFGSRPFLVADEVTLRIRLWPLLFGRVELTDLTLQKMRVEIIDAGGQLNVASLGPTGPAGRPAPRPPAGAAPAAGAAATISQVQIKGGSVHFVRRGKEPLDLRVEDMDFLVRPGGETYAVEGGARLAPGGLRVKLTQTSVTLPPGRALGDAPLRAAVEVSGSDMSEFGRGFLAQPTLRGPVEGRLRVTGTVSQPVAQGELAFSGLTVSDKRAACPPPPDRQLQLGDVRVPLSFTLARFDAAPLSARVGGGTVSARVAVALAPGANTVSLKEITVKGMELGPLLEDYLCQDFAVTGPLDLTGAAAFAAGDAGKTLDGTGQLRIGRGRVVGSAALALVRNVLTVAGAVTPIVGGRPTEIGQLVRPLDFESITATYRITKGVLETDDLVYQGESLTGNVAGTYVLADGRVNAVVTLSQGRTQLKARLAGVAPAIVVVPVGTGITEGGREAAKKLLERLLR